MLGSLSQKIILLSFILFLTFLIRIPFLIEPFDCDQAIYAYNAWGLQRGEVLYRDLLDNKPPGNFIFYRLIFNLFGYSVIDVHLAYSLLAVFTTLSLFWLASSIFKPTIALLSTLLYGLFSGGALISGSFANAENLMVFFIILAFCVFWKAYQREKKYLFFLCGIIIGFALMTKQSGLCEGIGMSVFLYLAYKRKGKGFLGLKRIMLIWLGAGIVLLYTWLYFLSKGAGKDFIKAVVIYNLFYGRVVGLQQGVINFWNSLSWTPRENFPLWVLAGLGAWLALKKKDEVSIFLLSWMVFAFLGVALPLRFYHNYFIQVIPPLVLLAAFALENLFWQKPSSTRKMILGIAILIVTIVSFIRVQWNYYFKYSPVESLIKRRGNLVRPQLCKATPQLAAFIKEKTKPDDYIYVWGLWTEIYYYSQRQSSSKYFFLPSYGVMIGKFSDLVQQEVLSDTIKNRPKYFIIDYHFAGLISAPLNKYLKDNYSLDMEIAGCQVLRRNDLGGKD